ncbi:MAG: hypothetical protein ABSE84_08840, partial [Isosphaeraceae bacterium]
GQGNGGSSCTSGKFPTKTAPSSINYRIVAFSRSHGEENQENSTKDSILSMVPIARHRAYDEA